MQPGSEQCRCMTMCWCGMQPAPGHTMADWNIIQACGIFAMSVSGHSSLPVLRNSMAKPQVRSPAPLCCQQALRPSAAIVFCFLCSSDHNSFISRLICLTCLSHNEAHCTVMLWLACSQSAAMQPWTYPSARILCTTPLLEPHTAIVGSASCHGMST